MSEVLGLNARQMLVASEQHLSLHLVSLLESLYSAPGVDYPLFACVERVASAAHFDLDLRLHRTGDKGIAAETRYFGIIVILRVNLGLH